MDTVQVDNAKGYGLGCEQIYGFAGHLEKVNSHRHMAMVSAFPLALSIITVSLF